MSLFGDLDLENASDDPFGVPDGTYEGILSSIAVRKPKDETKPPGLAINYTVTEENTEATGNDASEWLTIPPNESTPENKRAVKFLKRRLNTLGVPASQMNAITEEALQEYVGLEVYFTTKRNGQYTNITAVERRDALSGADETNPFA